MKLKTYSAFVNENDDYMEVPKSEPNGIINIINSNDTREQYLLFFYCETTEYLHALTKNSLNAIAELSWWIRHAHKTHTAWMEPLSNLHGLMSYGSVIQGEKFSIETILDDIENIPQIEVIKVLKVYWDENRTSYKILERIL